MIELSVADIAAAVSGDIVGDASARVTRVEHDSRAVIAGDLFFALVGETHDGHRYVEDAFAAGATCCVVNRAFQGDRSTDSVAALIFVQDTIAALGDLARYVRRQLSAKVIAITGSSGKTGTKDLLAAVCADQGSTVAPEGSFNNEFGVPLTILRADTDTKFLVVEMGARGAGHIDYLMAIAKPEIGIVLNVGTAHVGEFGSTEKIAQAKGELVQGLPPMGTAILNADDAQVAAMSRRAKARVRTFGVNESADFRISEIELDERARPNFLVEHDGDSQRIDLQISGEHYAWNATAVIAAAVAAGIDFENACASLSRAVPASKWRMEVTRCHDGTVVINDAYNANPDSVRAALKALAAMRPGLEWDNHLWAVLGEMRELGPQADALHEAVGEFAGQLGTDRVVGVGAPAEPLVAGANRVIEDGDAVLVGDVAEAKNLLRIGVAAGDVVLVKASRAVGLEDVAVFLIDEHGGPA